MFSYLFSKLPPVSRAIRERDDANRQRLELEAKMTSTIQMSERLLEELLEAQQKNEALLTSIADYAAKRAFGSPMFSEDRQMESSQPMVKAEMKPIQTIAHRKRAAIDSIAERIMKANGSKPE